MLAGPAHSHSPGGAQALEYRIEDGFMERENERRQAPYENKMADSLFFYYYYCVGKGWKERDEAKETNQMVNTSLHRSYLTREEAC